MNSQVEKIKTEIERLQLSTMDEHMNFYSQEAHGEYNALSKLESFIDSMQEEPVNIDFEHELYRYFGQVNDFTLGMRIAKRFYEIGKNHQEPVSEDLEEYAYQVAYDLSNDWIKDSPEWKDVETACKLGANWQKRKDNQDESYMAVIAYMDGVEKGKQITREQMMKEAVDAEVNYWNQHGLSIRFEDIRVEDIAGEGDKVKLIVIKED